MVSEDLLTINTKAELVVNTGLKLISGMFEVKGFTSDSVLMILRDDDDEILHNLEVHSKVTLNIYSQGGVVILSSKVKEAVKKEEEVIVIDAPTEVKRVQRRQFFRVGLQRPIHASYNDGYKVHTVKGKTIDLSGGGVRFWSLEKPAVGFMTDLKLYIQDYCGSNAPVDVKGRILYSRNHDSRFTSQSGYINVAQFGDMDQRTSQYIMQTCFKVQIEMRKKGIL